MFNIIKEAIRDKYFEINKVDDLGYILLELILAGI